MQLGYNGKKYGSRWLTLRSHVNLKEILTRRPVLANIRVTLPAGVATPKPLSKDLGQYRAVNMMALCKDFNAQTQMFKLDVPVVVTLNNTYEFMVKSPSVNWYLRKATSLDSGSSRLKHVVASELSLRHVYEIAKVNQSDPYFQYMPALESICKPLLSRIIE
ncbi:PREDICTED: 39S ribosomal [Prunus dulcis]|uniref:PREDICTED: 39S ribosomal n=1 Tax=Prunus dulcis TaxID=3755 RepID=A0A5E4GLY7_PRUDU|nr:PREDICTED: 39S ribosomal [Prunus dulcis]